MNEIYEKTPNQQFEATALEEINISGQIINRGETFHIVDIFVNPKSYTTDKENEYYVEGMPPISYNKNEKSEIMFEAIIRRAANIEEYIYIPLAELYNDDGYLMAVSKNSKIIINSAGNQEFDLLKFKWVGDEDLNDPRKIPADLLKYRGR